MIEDNPLPELGTTEAAVRSFVNLFALATKLNEEQLAYWLDCYYQIRAAHEKAAAFDGQIGMLVPCGAMPQESPAPEPAAARKKKLTPPEAGQERRKDWRAYKREVHARLKEAHENGVTLMQIVNASGGKLNGTKVLDLLETRFRPIEDYHALDAALDALAKRQEGEEDHEDQGNAEGRVLHEEAD